MKGPLPTIPLTNNSYCTSKSTAEFQGRSIIYILFLFWRSPEGQPLRNTNTASIEELACCASQWMIHHTNTAGASSFLQWQNQTWCFKNPNTWTKASAQSKVFPKLVHDAWFRNLRKKREKVRTPLRVPKTESIQLTKKNLCGADVNRLQLQLILHSRWLQTPRPRVRTSFSE